MVIKRVVPNITSDNIAESREFYTSLFGFQVAMDMDWIVTLVSPSDLSVQISLMRGEPPGVPPQGMTLTIEVGDVDETHGRAVSDGHPIIYPLTDESWGVRRFHVRDPNGIILNVMSHIP